MRTITIYRTVHIYFGDQRAVFRAAVEQCAHENGRVAVGHPTIEHTQKTVSDREFHLTRLIVDTGNAWWEEWLWVHGPELHVADLVASGDIDPAMAPRMIEITREQWRQRREAQRRSTPPAPPDSETTDA